MHNKPHDVAYFSLPKMVYFSMIANRNCNNNEFFFTKLRAVENHRQIEIFSLERVC